MDVVWARLCFYYFYALLLAQFAQYYSYVLFYLSVNFHPPILRCKHHMVLITPACML